jgi:ComF family protein
VVEGAPHASDDTLSSLDSLFGNAGASSSPLHLWRRVCEALFPARCLGCDRRGTTLCPECRAALPYLSAGVCARCAARLGPRGACRGCRQLSPALSVIRAGFAYEGAARTAVLTLKFKSGRYLAPLMGELLREQLALRPLQADVVVPVPLAARRMHQRGYNQALLLAEQIAPAVRGTVVPEALGRLERPAQRTLPATERLHNLLGSITCQEPAAVVNRRVLLVDDVVTTGATLSACAQTLAEAGARRVSALAFARDL